MQSNMLAACARMLAVGVTALRFVAPCHGATLIHYYPFHSDASDAVGLSHGTLMNGATATNGVLILDGTNDFVQFAEHLVPTAGSYSVAFFARQAVQQTNIVECISQGLSAGPGFYIGHAKTRTIRVSDDWTGTGRAFPEDCQWHHYAVTVDTNELTTLLFVDGVQQAIHYSDLPTTTAGTDTRFGRQFGSYAEYFNGQLAEMKIYTGALSAQDVALLAGNCHAQLIDFETLPDGSPPAEGMSISNQFASILGVNFCCEDGSFPRIAMRDSTNFTAFLGPGAIPNLFAANQNVGRYFLTAKDGATSYRPISLVASFSRPSASASGMVIDIDNGDSWEVTARDTRTNDLATIVLNSASANAGDGKAAAWSFVRPSADVSSIRLRYTGTANPVGLAFDNFAVSPGPATLSISATQPVPRIGLVGTPGRKYQIEWAASLRSSQWRVLTNVFVPDGTQQFLLDQAASNVPVRFYRTELVP